ncbi:hypothetical protein BGP75_08460 [Motiliproteus sp. MSK22-1]|nr:hypothetical protein BGP75_08460 [Motiliproteus sp. MSK22-1]
MCANLLAYSRPKMLLEHPEIGLFCININLAQALFSLWAFNGKIIVNKTKELRPGPFMFSAGPVGRDPMNFSQVPRLLRR